MPELKLLRNYFNIIILLLGVLFVKQQFEEIEHQLAVATHTLTLGNFIVNWVFISSSNIEVDYKKEEAKHVVFSMRRIASVGCVPS